MKFHFQVREYGWMEDQNMLIRAAIGSPHRCIEMFRHLFSLKRPTADDFRWLYNEEELP